MNEMIWKKIGSAYMGESHFSCGELPNDPCY